ncbi:hypothetical protein VTG60DRAFT_6098 [Thermothelomyces hinnuleus]
MAPGIRLMTSLFIVWGLLAPSVLGASTTSATSTSSAASNTRPSGAEYSLAVQMCWDKGAICSVAQDFRQECEEVQDAHGFDKYWECICTSGSGAVDMACDNCQDYYGIGGLASNTTSDCLSRGFTLAPIPSSIISQQSQHNATRATVLTTDTPTYVVTVHATQPESLPTIATTARLPLETGAASRQPAQYGLLMGGSVIAGLILAL